MSDGLRLDDLCVALRSLRSLAERFGYLPAPAVGVTTIWPERLELAFHDDLPGFEAWRDELGIAPDAVEYQTQSCGRTRVLKASVEYVGATVVLVAYAPVTVAVVGAA